jgi:selenocysteine-specific elongation factor
MGRIGQRCAINLSGSGLKRELIKRGDWVVTGDVPWPVQRLDARLRVLESEVRPLFHWTPVHVHLGAADVTGRVAILQSTSIAPGSSGLVQLVLERPIGALYGDSLIIRDQSAQRTIGGGRIIDIFPPVRGRAKPERLIFLQTAENDDPPSTFVSLLRTAPRGLNLTRFARNRNLTPEEATQIFAGTSTKSVATPSGLLGFSLENWSGLKAAVVETLASLHRRAPNVIPNEERVLLETGIQLPKEIASPLVAELTKEGAVVRELSGVRLRTHVAQLSPADAALWKKTEPLLNENPLRPPSMREITGTLGMDAKRTESFLVRVSRLGLLVRIAENRFFLPGGLRHYAKFAEEIAAANGGVVTAATLRDRAGLGRGLAIEVLEHFDRIKFTRRIGDEHHMLRSELGVFGEG